MLTMPPRQARSWASLSHRPVCPQAERWRQPWRNQPPKGARTAQWASGPYRTRQNRKGGRTSYRLLGTTKQRKHVAVLHPSGRSGTGIRLIFCGSMDVLLAPMSCPTLRIWTIKTPESPTRPLRPPSSLAHKSNERSVQPRSRVVSFGKASSLSANARMLSGPSSLPANHTATADAPRP